MNIKSRLKTIESKVKINHSPFCACEDFAGMIKPRVEVAYEKDGIQTIKNPIAEFCELCGKPIEKRQIIICFV